MEKKDQCKLTDKLFGLSLEILKLQKSRVQWLLHINITFFKQIKKQQQI